MVKQSRVIGSVSPSLAPGAAVLKEVSAKRIGVSKWKSAGRLSGVFTVGLLAALSAPREAKAIGFFTLNTSTALPAVQPCQDTSPGCYTSWVTTADIDGDGDMDILLANGGGYYATGKADESVVYLNDSNKGIFTDVTPTAFNNAHNRNRQIAVGDIDGDGDLDIYQPGGYGLDLDKLFVQTAPGVYEDRALTQLPDGLMSHAASCHMGDLDGDGDIDIINMDWNLGATNTVARAIMYTNDGTGKFTLAAVQHDAEFYTATDRLPATIAAAGVTPGLAALPAGQYTYWGVRPIDVDFADVDNDFDIDILVNMRNGFSRIFLNDGRGNFKDGTNFTLVKSADGLKETVSTNYPIKQGPYVYNQEVCDIDDDGDLDMLIDNVGPKPANNYSWAYGAGTSTSGTLDVSQILINDGHGKFVDDTVNRVTGEPGGDDNALKCADLNNDNHYDLIVATLTGRSEKLLMNDGTGHFNFVADGIPNGFSGTGTSGDSSLSHDLADFNGDGMLDMVTGQGEGGNFDEKVYYGGGGSVPDTRPPIFRAIQTPAPLAETPTVIRYALRDNVTNETGQMIKSTSVTYSLAGGAPKTVKGFFYGSDLFRATIPAQAAGAVVTVKIGATDRANNTATSPSFTFTVPTPVPPPVVNPGSGGDGSGGATGGSGGALTGSGGTSAGSDGRGEAGAAEAGEAGESSVGGETSVGGSSTSSGGKPSSGKAGSSSSVAGSGEAGEAASNAGSGGKGRFETVDDGGCSVSSSTPATKGRSAALLGLGLSLLGLVRRRKNRKQ
ncbi:MAG TPA: VCBS repeat-containing protein [Polyangiaceae bacterium]|nr:VCBS repeat-containing protein [Polyangiaceae bacterium]